MSQDVFNNIDPAIVGGTDLAGILNDFKDALMSGCKGPTRPTEITTGGFWVDDSQESGSNLLMFKMFDGTDDILIFTVNKATNSVAITGSSDSFEITKISADTNAPILSFLKKRVADSGRVLSGDVIGQIEFKAVVTGGTTQSVARIKWVASQDQTGSANGGYFVVEGTLQGQGSISEFARFMEGRLGLGTTAPSAALHIVSTTGIRNERSSADAIGPKSVSRKKRIASLGKVISGDELGTKDFNSTDDAGTEFTGVRLTVTADEDPTPTVRGAKLVLQAIKKGTNVLADLFMIAEGKKTSYVVESIDALERQTQTFASVTDVPALDMQKSFIEVTGTTAMTIRGISNDSRSRNSVIYNGSTQNIIFVSEDVSITANDRVVVNGEPTFTLQPGKSVEIMRKVSNSRWITMVEGNTGITYNEATGLMAELIAKSLNINKLVPTIALASAPDLTAIAATSIKTLFSVGNIGSATHVILITQYGAFLSSGALGANWNGSWARGAGASTSAVFVRPTGTARLLYAQYTVSWTTSDLGVNNAMDWRDVAFNGSAYVIVSSAGASRIGVYTGSWTYIAATTVDVPLRSVAYGNSLLVAVGGVIGASPNHSAWVSSNGGSTWTSYALPNEATIEYSLVRYCNNLFITIGDVAANGQKLLTSPDGQTWTARATLPVGITVTGIAYTGGMYMASTDIDQAIISTDGVNWSAVDSNAMAAICSSNGKFFGTVGGLGFAPIYYNTLSPSF